MFVRLMAWSGCHVFVYIFTFKWVKKKIKSDTNFHQHQVLKTCGAILQI